MMRFTQNLQHQLTCVHFTLLWSPPLSQPATRGHQPSPAPVNQLLPDPDSGTGEQLHHSRHVCDGLTAQLTDLQEVLNRSSLPVQLNCILSLRHGEFLAVYPDLNGAGSPIEGAGQEVGGSTQPTGSSLAGSDPAHCLVGLLRRAFVLW